MNTSAILRPIPVQPDHRVDEFDFEPLPGNTHHLVILMKDLKRIVELPLT